MILPTSRLIEGGTSCKSFDSTFSNGASGFLGMTKKPQIEKEIELHSDAWERFERAAGVVAKSPPQHRQAKKAKRTKKAAKKKR
jgi:hypothetical protein